MSFTTDEVNLLVHRYLVESGYAHAAFTFYTEVSPTQSSQAAGPCDRIVAYGHANPLCQPHAFQ